MAESQTPAAGASPDGETTPPVAPARKTSPRKQKRPRSTELAAALKNVPQWKALAKELAEIRARLNVLESKAAAKPLIQGESAAPIGPVVAEGPPRISNLKRAQMKEQQRKGGQSHG